MIFSYPKEEKLKHKKNIELLFTKGKSVNVYPIRLVFIPSETSDSRIKMGVSVSKKYFKKAVDRNYYKRILRECYRLNKHILLEKCSKPHLFMLLYQTKEPLSFNEIQEKTIEVFKKFASTVK